MKDIPEQFREIVIKLETNQLNPDSLIDNLPILHFLVGLVVNAETEPTILKVIESFIKKHSVNVNLLDSQGKTPIFYFTDYSSIKALKLLIEKGVKLDHKDQDGLTAFHQLVLQQQFKIAKGLLEAKVNVDIKAGDGPTALNLALQHQLPEVIDFLLQNKADPYIESGKQKQPVRKSFCSKLFDGCKKKPITSEKDFTLNYKEVRNLKVLKVFLDHKIIEPSSYINAAIKQKNYEALELGLKAWVKDNVASDSEAQQLLKEGDVMHWLTLKACVDPTSKIKTKESLIFKRAIEIISTNGLNIDGLPINRSKSGDQIATIEESVKSYIYHDLPSPLTIAISRKNLVIAEILLELNADINYLSKDGISLWYYACRYDNIFKLLITFITSKNRYIDDTGDSLIHHAVRSQDGGVLSLLSKKDEALYLDFTVSIAKSLNAQNKYGVTPLILAVKLQNVAMVDFLLRIGSIEAMHEKLLAQDQDGNTAMHHAVLLDNITLIASLCLKPLASTINVKNKFGQTPLNYIKSLAVAVELLSKCKPYLQPKVSKAMSATCFPKDHVDKLYITNLLLAYRDEALGKDFDSFLEQKQDEIYAKIRKMPKQEGELDKKVSKLQEPYIKNFLDEKRLDILSSATKYEDRKEVFEYLIDIMTSKELLKVYTKQQTILHIAAIAGDAELIKLVLDKTEWALIYMANKRGETPYSIIMNSKNIDSILSLIDYVQPEQLLGTTSIETFKVLRSGLVQDKVCGRIKQFVDQLTESAISYKLMCELINYDKAGLSQLKLVPFQLFINKIVSESKTNSWHAIFESLGRHGLKDLMYSMCSKLKNIKDSQGARLLDYVIKKDDLELFKTFSSMSNGQESGIEWLKLSTTNSSKAIVEYLLKQKPPLVTLGNIKELLKLAVQDKEIAKLFYKLVPTAKDWSIKLSLEPVAPIFYQKPVEELPEDDVHHDELKECQVPAGAYSLYAKTKKQIFVALAKGLGEQIKQQEDKAWYEDVKEWLQNCKSIVNSSRGMTGLKVIDTQVKLKPSLKVSDRLVAEKKYQDSSENMLIVFTKILSHKEADRGTVHCTLHKVLDFSEVSDDLFVFEDQVELTGIAPS